MPNLWRQFQDLLLDPPLLIGEVVRSDGEGVRTVELLDGALVRAKGEGAVGTRVFVRAGRIEGAAPDLPQIEIEI